GKGAAHADEDHRQGHRGTGVQRGHLSRDHEDARTDDGADAERDEIDGPEGPRQGVLTTRLRLGAEDGDGLGGEEGHSGNWGTRRHPTQRRGTDGTRAGTSGTHPLTPCPPLRSGEGERWTDAVLLDSPPPCRIVRSNAEPEGIQHVIPDGSQTCLILGPEIECDEALDAIDPRQAHPRAALPMLSRVDHP